ncbi:MAG: beta-ketoacyl-ACP synthase III [Pseudomonadota bacterium]
MRYAAVVRGAGSYLPERILSNDEISQLVDTTDQWIQERTGIKSRHVAADGEFTSDLAAHAARRALVDAGVKASDIDLIVLATTTPDKTFPATAAIVQAKIDAAICTAFDVQAVCCGFVFALATASAFLQQGTHRKALVIGAETFTRIVDWTDRSTCVLFGDGAGAFVLEAEQLASGENDDPSRKGILASHTVTDGRLADLLHVDGGPSTTGTVGHVKMQGNRLFRQAIDRICNAMEVVSAKAGISMQEIDWFVPHQANERILNGVVERLSLDRSKVVSTIADQGNTSAASIPLAFDEAKRDGRLKPGDLIMIEGLGGGLTWGAALLRL